jgi:hypothetical protein
LPRSRTPLKARVIVGASGNSPVGAREQDAIPFFSSKRIRTNIAEVLADKDCWLTPAYSLAIQAEHLLQVVEGKRAHKQRAKSGKNRKWGAEKRAELLADPRTHAELAEVYGCSASAISQQRWIAQREAAA